MKILLRSVAPLALLLAASSCNRLKSSASGDGGAAADPAGGSGAALVLAGFEGEIGIVTKGKMAGKDGATPMNITTFIKGDKIRLDAPPGMAGTESLGGKGWGVFNGGEKKLFIVDDGKKTAMVIDLNKTENSPLKGFAGHGAPGGGAQKPPPKVTKTGKTDVVAGHKCDIWQVEEEGKGKVGDACIANEGFSWFSLPSAHLPTEHAWAAELMDGKHFPLRFIGYEGGAETGRIEVTRIEKKTLAATLFEIPAGYKIMDLSQMMGGMGGMPSGMPSGFRPPPRRQ